VELARELRLGATDEVQERNRNDRPGDGPAQRREKTLPHHWLVIGRTSTRD
jgi:hypothetical protein